MTRREILAALLGAALFATAPCRAATAAVVLPRRVVALDWTLTEMLLSLRVVPVGMANPHGFRHNFPASSLPESVVDVGLIFQPNMELLLALKPDVIVITPAHASLRTSLEQIAPTLTFGPSRSEPTPYAAACAATLRMADLFDCPVRGTAVLSGAATTIGQARRDLAALPAKCRGPLFVTYFIDGLNLHVFGPGSLFGTMLTALGLDNAWHAPTNAAGFATTGIDALNGIPDAILVYLEPLPSSVSEMMKNNRLWRAMLFVNTGRVVALPTISPNGGVVSAAYFARTLAHALLNGQQRSNVSHTTPGGKQVWRSGAVLRVA